MDQCEIVVLANSVKHRQHCVAGKLIGSNQWVRPVSTPMGGEISHAQARCQNPMGSFPLRPLQRVRIGLTDHVPLLNQPENYLIDGSSWVQNYCLPEQDLVQYLDAPENLWGLGDRVSHWHIQQRVVHIAQSLYLVKVENLQLYINAYGKKRGSFFYNEMAYDLAVTDPKFDAILRGNRPLQGILCISLGCVFEGYCFKLVACLF